MTDPYRDPPDPAPGWQIYSPGREPHDGIDELPPPPPWRVFEGGPPLELPDDLPPEPAGLAVRAHAYQITDSVADLVNVAILLRRPMLVTGKPGSGKSSLARSIAYQLRLGPLLTWPVTSRAVLRDALYRYDPIGRLGTVWGGSSGDGGASAADEPAAIGRFVTLGPLGTALLPWRRPRVLLIDEFDKSDVDLPNDLLNVFEDGTFEIPELARLPAEAAEVVVHTAESQPVPVWRGHVRCREFPIVVITSNGEREFPPPFLRRCIRIEIAPPSEDALRRIVADMLGPSALAQAGEMITEFVRRRQHADIATDQLLNAVYLVTSGRSPGPDARGPVTDALLRDLDPGLP